MIKITITKFRITGRILGENIIEDRKQKLDDYTETKSDLNVPEYDLAGFKQEFINKIAQSVVNQNKAEERKFKKKKVGQFVRLVITNIN